MLNPLFKSLIESMEHAIQPIQRELGMAAPVIDPLSFSSFDTAKLQVNLLRLDQVHPVVSGNKWYKLKYNLLQAMQMNASTLVTFGGAWSNHLHAFSYVGKQLGFKTVVLMRGEEWERQSNPMIDDIKQWGTELRYLSRGEYRLRNDPAFQQAICDQYLNSYLIPEGGDNFLGILGMASVFMDLAPCSAGVLSAADTVALACGTGNSVTGVRLALPARQRVIGVSALKGQWQKQAIQQKLALFWPLKLSNCSILTEFHCGGFGKLSAEIKAFVSGFEASTQVQLDPVYTAKLLYGMVNLASDGYFEEGHRLLLVHTGGMQGRRSLLLNT